MKDSTQHIVNQFPTHGPELSNLSLDVTFFLEIGFFTALAGLVHHIGRHLIHVMGNTGVFEKRNLMYQLVNAGTLVLPGFIFLYGLTLVSQKSLFISLLFFVVFSVVLAFSLVGPAQSLMAFLLIHLKEELKQGDTIRLKDQQGEVYHIGVFHILIVTQKGARIFIPTHQLSQHSYEIQAKKGGGLIHIHMDAEKISRHKLEQLAHLCPFKRKGSDIRILTSGKEHQLTLELVNQESGGWVQGYFNQGQGV